MSRKPMLDVVVIGAGVVGAAAALAASRRGLKVALVEAKPAPQWQADQADLRVYALAADNRELLADLGVWDAIASARAHAYREMRVWDAAGGGELHLSADAMGQRELGHIVENDLLVDRLLAAVRARPELRVFCPDRVAAIADEGDSVRVELHNGERLRARLVVGADGAASRTRELLGLDCDRHDYHQRGLVAYVRTALPHADTAWQRFLPGGPLAFLPCGDGSCSIVWTLPEAEAARLLAVDDEAFCRELTRAFDARLGEVTGVGARVAFPLRRQLARDYGRGRVLLLGDAAHAVHPLAGQGVNLGLRDVAALTGLFEKAQARGADIGASHRLQRWAREQRSDAAVAAYSFEAINRLYSNDALMPTLLRGHLLGLAGRVPLLGSLLWARAAGR